MSDVKIRRNPVNVFTLALSIGFGLMLAFMAYMLNGEVEENLALVAEVAMLDAMVDDTVSQVIRADYDLQASLQRNEELLQRVQQVSALDPTDFLLAPVDILDLVDMIPKGNPFEGEWYVTSRYGSDAGFEGSPRRGHRGQDMGSYGTWNLTPIADGKVIDIGIGEYEGKWILIEHNEYVRVKIQHLEKIFYTALPGEEVTEDTVIGIMGSTGMSDAAHLHIEIFLFNGEDWNNIDPYPYLTGERQ